MRDYLKEFNGDVIGDFLVENDISKILSETTAGKNAPTDDGPPTFYKNLSDYKQESKGWVESLQNDLGWKVVQYILGKGAMDPARRGAGHELGGDEWQPALWLLPFRPRPVFLPRPQVGQSPVAGPGTNR